MDIPMSEGDWDGENSIIDAFKAEVSEHKRLEAMRFILEDMGFIACAALQQQDSCIKSKEILARKVPI